MENLKNLLDTEYNGKRIVCLESLSANTDDIENLVKEIDKENYNNWIWTSGEEFSEVWQLGTRRMFIPRDIENRPVSEVQGVVYHCILTHNLDSKKAVGTIEDKTIVVICETQHAVCLSII